MNLHEADVYIYSDFEKAKFILPYKMQGKVGE